MKNNELTHNQAQAVQKEFEWMARSKPSASARCSKSAQNGQSDGIALPPHERDCGRSHPMRGTNSEDLTEWCVDHQT